MDCERQAIANDYYDTANSFSVQARDFVAHDFYDDDGIASVSDIHSACELARHAREICSKGGVRLHKFISNSVDVMKSIPVCKTLISVMIRSQ